MPRSIVDESGAAAAGTAQRRNFGPDADQRVMHAHQHGATFDDRARHARDDRAAAIQENLTHKLITPSTG